jgi:Protein CHAPERONE-LIKE PROTEIN OF POR1-like
MEENRMNDLSPYEKLQVTEGASFEEVQAARDRLVKLNESDESQRELIEAAYDAVLMDRLRQRQEGKIKVPERIRFAERRQEETTSKPLIATITSSPSWLPSFVEQPTVVSMLVPTSLYGVLSVISLYASMGLTKLSPPQTLEALSSSLGLLLAVGIGFSIYWLNRKEKSLFRAFGLTLAGILLATLAGAALWQAANPMLPNLPAITLVTVIIFVVLWLLNSFFK